MATTDNKALINARFFVHTEPDEAKSKAAGRPIYREYEAVELRFAANKQTVHVAPAHEEYRIDKNFQTGEVNKITYAMDFNEQYKKFKEGVAQDQSGTPLSELPFLTASKRLELKALSIHTAEALAALDGPNLRNLGMDGRELKNQAQAYLDKAAGSVDVVKMAATIAQLQEKLARLEGQPVATAAADDVAPSTSPFAPMEAEDIKNWIKESGGTVPRGNASHATLVKAADELNAELKRKAQQAEAA
jgi:hypothetical protein